MTTKMIFFTRHRIGFGFVAGQCSKRHDLAWCATRT